LTDPAPQARLTEAFGVNVGEGRPIFAQHGAGIRNFTDKEERMISLESKEVREQASHWIEDGQRQLGVLLGLLNDYDRLLELAEASERENERLRGLSYEIEQVRNRLETSERQCDQLREEVHRLRTDTERHQKERVEIADSMTMFMNEVLGRLRPEPA